MRPADLLLALRLARRELRGGLRGFGVFLACLALGVGAVSAVGTLTSALEEGVRRDARSLLGGDLEVLQSHRPPGPAAEDFLRPLGAISEQVRMRAMARAEDGNSTVVEVKAVDAAYPLYGRLVLSPDRPLAEVLAGGDGLPGAAAAPQLLSRLGLKLGDTVRLGQTRFKLLAEVRTEPDRSSQLFSLGPRLLISAPALRSTGLLAPGSIVTYAVLARLRPGLDARTVKTEMEKAFPGETGWRIREYGQAAGGVRRSLDNISLYLTLVGLSSLLLGGIGVAGAVRGLMATRLDALAAMKAVGGQRAQVGAAVLLQVLLLAGLGSVLGLAAGALTANIGALFVSSRLGLPAAPGLYAGPLASGLAYGLLTALAFSIWPLSAAVAVSPSRLFRGYGDPGRRRPGPWAVAVSLAAGAALFLLTLIGSPAPRVVLGFTAGVILSTAGLFLLARAIKFLAKRIPHVRDPRLRLALANLHRPGSGVTPVVFSLGLGLAVLATVVLADLNLRDQLDGFMPQAAPSYFYLDIPKDELATFRKTVLAVPGVRREEHAPSLRGRVVLVNGVPAEKIHPDPDVAWVLRGDRGLSTAREMPAGTRITAGHWWPSDYSGPPLVSFDEQAAKGLGLGLGDTLTLDILGREVTATIASLRAIEWSSLALNHVIILSPGVLDAAPYTYIATVYADPGADEALHRAVSEVLPDLTAIYVRDVLNDVRRLAANIGLAVRAASSVALLAGLLVLSQALRANLRARHFDAVVFKVFGATRADVLLSLAAEFCLLGLVTALAASAIGTLAARAFVLRLLHGAFSPHLLPLALCSLAGVLATLGLGLLGVRRVLSQEAWPVLRNE